MRDHTSDHTSDTKNFRYGKTIAWLVVAIAIMVIAVTQLLGYQADPPPPLNDPAIRNLVTLFATIIVALTLWLWFCLGSHYSRRSRMIVAVASILGLVAFGSVVVALKQRGILSFSGSLVPRLSMNDRKTPVQASSGAQEIDLQSESSSDFPQFLGPDRNSWIGTVELSRDWQSQPPRELWKQPIGAGWSSFAARNGFAITMEQRGTDEMVTCYEIATGLPVWSHSIAAHHDTTLGGVGPRGTPTIHAGKVYALGATGVLRCLKSNGELIWSEDLRKQYGVSAKEDEEHVMFGRASSPLIVDDMVVVAGGGPQGNARNLVAFDQLTGQLKWEAQNQLSDGSADQIAYASPTLANVAGRRQILMVNESTASGHDPTNGQRIWTHPWPGRSNGNASVSQCVPIGEDRVLLTKGYGGGAELLELTDSGDDQLTVKSLWKVARVLQTKFSNVVVHQQHAYALSEGILECVAVETGKRRWKNGRFGHGQILGVGSLVLVLSEDGELNLIELNADKYTPLGSHQVLEGKSWNNLCLYGKQLLLRNAEVAACYELP